MAVGGGNQHDQHAGQLTSQHIFNCTLHVRLWRYLPRQSSQPSFMVHAFRNMLQSEVHPHMRAGAGHARPRPRLPPLLYIVW